LVAVAWEGVRLERPEAEPRTNELDADERRRMIGAEEAPVWRGVVVVPGGLWLSERVSHAPIRSLGPEGPGRP
jgi:hypothetical protein